MWPATKQECLQTHISTGTSGPPRGDPHQKFVKQNNDLLGGKRPSMISLAIPNCDEKMDKKFCMQQCSMNWKCSAKEFEISKDEHLT